MKQSSTMVQDVSEKRAFVTTLRALAVSLRPYQWVKNTLVFGGLIFSHSMFHWSAVWQSIEAFMVFCMASSSVYLLNDICDLEEDRRHPVKRLRPLAAGALSPTLAAAAMVVFFGGSLADSFRLRPAFGGVVLTYLVLNIAYSLWLKRVAILDVMIVASGIVFRAIAGAVVIGVVPSPWLILCTMTLALLVGFGKRRHELTLLNEEAQNHRLSLEGYSVQFLDLMMAISAAAAVVSYALYTMAEETVRRFGTRRLILTVPWVIYGIFRYLYLIHKRSGGGDPAKLFLTDFPTLLNVALWVTVVCFVLYGPTGWWPW
jgi:4-hydroxybenzoate polyprenyltransferase